MKLISKHAKELIKILRKYKGFNDSNEISFIRQAREEEKTKIFACMIKILFLHGLQVESAVWLCVGKG